MKFSPAETYNELINALINARLDIDFGINGFRDFGKSWKIKIGVWDMQIKYLLAGDKTYEPPGLVQTRRQSLIRASKRPLGLYKALTGKAL